MSPEAKVFYNSFSMRLQTFKQRHHKTLFYNINSDARCGYLDIKKKYRILTWSHVYMKMACNGMTSMRHQCIVYYMHDHEQTKYLLINCI